MWITAQALACNFTQIFISSFSLSQFFFYKPTKRLAFKNALYKASLGHASWVSQFTTLKRQLVTLFLFALSRRGFVFNIFISFEAHIRKKSSVSIKNFFLIKSSRVKSLAYIIFIGQFHFLKRHIGFCIINISQLDLENCVWSQT